MFEDAITNNLYLQFGEHEKRFACNMLAHHYLKLNLEWDEMIEMINADLNYYESQEKYETCQMYMDTLQIIND